MREFDAVVHEVGEVAAHLDGTRAALSFLAEGLSDLFEALGGGVWANNCTELLAVIARDLDESRGRLHTIAKS